MGLEYYTPGGLNLTTNDSNRRQSVPESGEGALLAVISEGGASSLKLIDQRDQILHVYGRMDVTKIALQCEDQLLVRGDFSAMKVCLI